MMQLSPVLIQAIRRQAHQLGFDFCSFAPAGEAPHADFFDAWIEAGRAGEMSYLERHREKRRFPALLAEPPSPPFETMVVLAVDYHQFDLPPEVRNDPSRGIIASYAWGDDYHEILRPLLYELDAFIRSQTGRSTLGKCLVDTGPVLERDWAAVAGIGFTGKNCCTIRPSVGSWLFLAVILIPERLPAGWTSRREEGREEEGKRPMTCGRCTRCLSACPTDAFVGPYELDPLRCIAYWTIEARSIIPRSLRSAFGNRIFGCDICQEVCPYNRRLGKRTPRLAGLRARHERVAPPLLEGFDPAHPYWLNQEAFNKQFARSPVRRARRGGMLRNVCVALGNWGAPATVPALAHALRDPEPVARAHAAWALGRVLARQPHEQAANLLAMAMEQETDSRVREEIHLALHGV
ncbi:tRNA epoxyqueuosine(34) reductase QueG [Caldilinea sp.]|jgi:epoxyqueuosine reductase|uniref:tRNA epoxyqueuosine(34) reductase QueG n=1 Tax=Caldilinea sp. TaxID=2293560 RepID=UPI0025900237|nr:tRNA epoxyqueuosine(34) reductase QueG [Caldilinea sp.]